MKKEQIYEKLGKQVGWKGKEDQRDLEKILTAPALLRALAEVLKESDAQASALLVADLVTPHGLSQAHLAQGFARGLSRAVEIVVDLAEEQEDE